MAEAKDALGTFIAEFDEAELACHIIENVCNGEFPRPEGVSAAEALDSLREKDRDMWLKIARCSLRYIGQCIEDAQRIQ